MMNTYNSRFNIRNNPLVRRLALAGLISLGVAGIYECFSQGYKREQEIQRRREELSALPIEQAFFAYGEGIDSFTAQSVSVKKFPRSIRRENFEKLNKMGRNEEPQQNVLYWRPYEITSQVVAQNSSQNKKSSKKDYN